MLKAGAASRAGEDNRAATAVEARWVGAWAEEWAEGAAEGAEAEEPAVARRRTRARLTSCRFRQQ